MNYALLEDAIRRLWKAEDDLNAVKGQLRQARGEREQAMQEASQARQAHDAMERMLNAHLLGARPSA
ncbi:MULTISPECIES: hypothetical protein [unclassified Mesorhizobium]|uniref:hypothetical protein n=1 Tax=unclassified Mesorhizobium TaxID=325217 RepID=UPI000FCBDC5A|nr:MULTISPECIES: hypothetical protein [unclassified Mesorhizobium]RUT86788.1 hypothetical protein EOD15_24610 [Mesorhizobium sp. M7A.T.Ca.US.000.02.2.1]RUT87633.1 hypothetical protein EOD14_09550 [Mesorhizobium sp. M7A.T.Ca.US.000.02.1.1]